MPEIAPTIAPKISSIIKDNSKSTGAPIKLNSAKVSVVESTPNSKPFIAPSFSLIQKKQPKNTDKSFYETC